MHLSNEIRRIINNEISGTLDTATYARVSTDNEGQKNSCANQLKDARDYVHNHENLNLSDKHCYVDDGVSGKSVTHRQSYQEMMKAVENHEFQLIIVKTNSRLFRSVIEAQVFMNTLLRYGVILLTLSNNKVWDFEDDGDATIFTFESVMNAHTSRVQSDAGKGVQNRRIRDKKLFSKDVVPGFIWDASAKDIRINTTASEHIVFIFEEYVYRNGTPSSICKTLMDKNIKFPRGRRDPETKVHYIEYIYLSEKTISTILTNSKYIGLFAINQRGSKFIPGSDTLRFKNPKEDWVIVERPDLQIVDKDLFAMAQKLHDIRVSTHISSNRVATQAYFQGIHTFANKIFCAVCGKAYHFSYSGRKTIQPIYRIRSHNGCDNHITHITETDMESIIRNTLKEVVSQRDTMLTSLEKVLIECVKSSQENTNDIKQLENQKVKTLKKIDALLDNLTSNDLNYTSKQLIRKKINILSTEVDNLTKKITDKESNKLSESYVTDKIDRIKNAVSELRNFKIIDRNRVLIYIDRIDIYSNGNMDITLKSGQIIKLEEQLKATESIKAVKMRKQDVLYSLR